MFIAMTTYQNGEPPPRVAVEDHWRYLDEQYAAGRLVCTGPQASGTGGVLVLRVTDEQGARALIDADPIVRRGHVTYELTEFRATRAADPTMVET